MRSASFTAKFVFAFLFGSLLILPLVAQAVVETYEFDDEVQRKRYNQFIDELRCPKCQNQNLSGSDAPIAKDLRRELHRLIIDGRADQEITQFMVDRYGDFVLYRPQFNAKTALLWASPILLLLIGGLIWWRQTRRVPPQQNTALSEADKQRFAALMADEKGGQQ